MSRRQMLLRLSLCLLLLTGCATYNAYTQLPAEEQGLYRAYSHIMTLGQRRAYLALPTAVERAAYARQVGAIQRLESLSVTGTIFPRLSLGIILRDRRPSWRLPWRLARWPGGQNGGRQSALTPSCGAVSSIHPQTKPTTEDMIQERSAT
jgi:hypothetical protein